MKKLFIISLLALTLAASACGKPGTKPVTSGSAGTDKSPVSSGTVTDEPKSDGFVFTFGGKEICRGMSGADAVAILGEYENKTESPSCAFDGTETAYYYSSVQLTTYTDKSQPEKVLSIYLQDDSVSTGEKISVGDAKDKVMSTYGAPADESENGATFEKNGTKLSFVFRDGAVSSILYSFEG